MNADLPRSDLRSALLMLADAGLLRSVKRPVDPAWEVSSVLDALERAGQLPAVLFEAIAGHADWSVAGNLFATRRNVATLLGSTPEDLTQELARRLASPLEPVLVESGPVHDVVLQDGAASLDRVPLVTHHAGDAAPYISMGVTVCRDPDTGRRNVGIYRYMRQTDRTLVPSLTSNANIADIFRRCEERGLPLDVVILPGVHPLIALAAAYNAPIGTDEYAVAGALLGEPLPLVRARCVDLEVPAQAELAIEARILPGERHPEAPFADMSRSYSRIKQGPLTEVLAITHRRRPIHEIAFSGHPDATNMAAICSEVAIYEVARRAAAGLVAVSVPPSGYGFHCYLAIRKRPTVEGRERGEQINAMLATLGAVPQIKLVIAFDDDVDIFDDTAVLGALARRFQAVDARTRESRITVIPAAKGATYDPSSFHREFPNAKVMVDATLGSDLTDEQRGAFSEARTPRGADIDLADYIDMGAEDGGRLLAFLLGGETPVSKPPTKGK